MGRSAKFVWSRDPSAIVGHLQGLIRQRAIQTSRSVFDDLVALTPVDTGVARANWRVSVNAPDYSHISVRIKGMTLPPPSFPLTTIPLYGRIYITNNTEYIMALEYGSSKQAPQGMMRLTMAKHKIGVVGL